MHLRPVDENGDMLPALSSSSMLSGTDAAAELIRDRLSLYTGEWWENPALGNGIPDLLMSSRPTESDAQAIAADLTSYIRETPGVLNVRDISFSTEDHRFCYSCTVETGNGNAEVNYRL